MEHGRLLSEGAYLVFVQRERVQMGHVRKDEGVRQLVVVEHQLSEQREALQALKRDQLVVAQVQTVDLRAVQFDQRFRYSVASLTAVAQLESNRLSVLLKHELSSF